LLTAGLIAPISRTSSGLLKKFKSARVTFWADWTESYDQAGLLLVPKRVHSLTHPPEKWLKAGLELYDGKPHLSAVGCDRYADWHLSPLTTPINPSKGLTIEISRAGNNESGKSLWIYQLILDEQGTVKERIPMRQVCWILADEDERDGEEWVLDVSPLIARPAKEATESLKVHFFEFTVGWLP